MYKAEPLHDAYAYLKHKNYQDNRQMSYKLCSLTWLIWKLNNVIINLLLGIRAVGQTFLGPEQAICSYGHLLLAHGTNYYPCIV